MKRGDSRRFAAGAPGTGSTMAEQRKDIERDPYLRDPNISRAASLQIVFGGVLGAGLGWALAGWFDFSIAIGIIAGAVIGYVIAHVLLLEYGGRSTR